jgi:hypothetical protein
MKCIHHFSNCFQMWFWKLSNNGYLRWPIQNSAHWLETVLDQSLSLMPRHWRPWYRWRRIWRLSLGFPSAQRHLPPNHGGSGRGRRGAGPPARTVARGRAPSRRGPTLRACWAAAAIIVAAAAAAAALALQARAPALPAGRPPPAPPQPRAQPLPLGPRLPAKPLAVHPAQRAARRALPRP